jgi:RNA polymerase primary sigma factor
MAMKPLVISERITKRESISFKRYLTEVDRIERLTTDEEYEVAMKAFHGDDKAKEELITKNLRFVISVAKQYVTKDVKLEDLVNEGNIGLVKAAERFDPTKGFKFISYAVWWIRRCIIEYLCKHSRTIKISANKAAIIKPMNEIVEQLQQKHGRDPSNDEVIEVASEDFSPKEIKFFLSLENIKTTSLDTPLSEDGSGVLIDTIEGDDLPRTDHLVKKSDDEMYADQLIDLLKNDGQKTVIIKLFGLDGKPPLELKEIAQHMELSRERVRQVRDQALRILKSKASSLNLQYMYNK